MTVTSVPPAILLSDKLMTITNLHILVLVILDVDEMNYSSWVYFFKNHYRGFELLEHLLGNLTAEVAPSTPMPPDSEWLKALDILAEIFSDNKLSWCIALKAELRSMKLGDLSIDAYFLKLSHFLLVWLALVLPLAKMILLTLLLLDCQRSMCWNLQI
nr:hypothetical protein [Tanacetum cinerariifolium]